MAINLGDNATAQDAQNTNEKEAPRTASRADQRRGQGFGNAVRGVHRSFSRRATSEVVRGFKNAFDTIINQTETYGDAEGKFIFYNFPIDGDQHALPISSLVFVREEAGLSAVLVLSLAATASELPDRYVRAGQDEYGNAKQISLPQTPSDIWEFSNAYRRVLQEEIDARLGNKKYEVIGNIVLPAHVTAEDSDILDSTLWRIVDNLENFLFTAGKFNQVFTPSLSELLPNEVLKARLEFNQPQGQDSLGNVRRQDVNVRVISEIRNGNNKDRDDEIRVTEVGCVSGYMDAVYVGRDPANNATVWNMDNIQSFMPAFVITSLDSQQNAVTAESIGFNLAAVAVLARENRWIGAFRGQGTKNPLRHLGALGCQLPKLGSDISHDGSYTPMGKVANDENYRFAQMAQMAFHLDSLIFFLDIEESGEMSPMLSAISDIADSNNAGAVKFFVNALDNLTAGVFSNLWRAAGEPRLFESNDLRIPLGNVRLEEGSDKPFDIRTLDQIAINNLEDEIEEIEEYNEAFYGLTFRGDSRTEVITRYLRSRYAGLVNITGYARRVLVTTDLLRLLSDAFFDNNALIEPDVAYDTFGQTRRGNSNFIRAGYSADGSRMFRTGSRGGNTGNRFGSLRDGWSNR